ncbi:hypothetical protein TSUD_327090 [Trifolium subterraneum]|uniref:Uncharacterized protein n=1 Tax=Trifolium subterraneum TaxID=3900 RepID=A0A2Z6PJ63_TRISU|nr:hypothetical protein TSUD_327090 [Trifolium subterraneum]
MRNIECALSSLNDTLQLFCLVNSPHIESFLFSRIGVGNRPLPERTMSRGPPPPHKVATKKKYIAKAPERGKSMPFSMSVPSPAPGRCQTLYIVLTCSPRKNNKYKHQGIELRARSRIRFLAGYKIEKQLGSKLQLSQLSRFLAEPYLAGWDRYVASQLMRVYEPICSPGTTN